MSMLYNNRMGESIKLVKKLQQHYQEVLNKLLALIVEALPTLLTDKDNVTVCCLEPKDGNHPYEVHYKNQKVASFCILIIYDDELLKYKASVEDMQIFLKDEELKYL